MTSFTAGDSTVDTDVDTDVIVVIDTDVLGHYRVSIDRLYRRSIEYRDVCIEYRRAGLGVVLEYLR